MAALRQPDQQLPVHMSFTISHLQVITMRLLQICSWLIAAAPTCLALPLTDDSIAVQPQTPMTVTYSQGLRGITRIPLPLVTGTNPVSKTSAGLTTARWLLASPQAKPIGNRPSLPIFSVW